METILKEIIHELRCRKDLDDKRLAKIIHRHNRELAGDQQHYSKKRLLPYYLKVKEGDPTRWASWGIDQATEQRLLATLQVKPRRTSSGVATITVLTKPWPCSSDCLYCPSDLRMPKSYLCDEPACQRAERNFFDPYLQVMSRLRALTQMGHPTDKVELIILGGTWSDYPQAYQIWFVAELFRALNDGLGSEQASRERRRVYKEGGISNHDEELAKLVQRLQQQVDDGFLTYNQAVEQLYGDNSAWQELATGQRANLDELTRQHQVNETALHRAVGLVVETRPDAISSDSLLLLRRLGCTKIQMGIQSLDSSVLALNNRGISLDTIRQSFELLRIFGFKIHVHFMLNLLGSSCASDKLDYCRMVSEDSWLPDEVKLYPCALVNGTRLCAHYAAGNWRPYSEDELLDVLCADTLRTPPFMRISRMIRDISAQDILAGNKKANLRQMVENRIEQSGAHIAEIRHREIRTDVTDTADLTLQTITYKTTVTNEYFLQWVTPSDRIAGFLRLSLPEPEYVRARQAVVPIEPYQAMIREVHVYGRVALLRTTVGEEGALAARDGALAAGEGAKPHSIAQHLGLGRQLIEAACAIAKAQGYQKLNVISSVGTREYYRSLGFYDTGLYQQMILDDRNGDLSASAPIPNS